MGAHTAVPSASLLLDDPNLLFVNAGMVPFKPYFLGQETPPYPRAVSVQKCVRTPDIEDVGKTTRHGTFFEMCGNFSFGDYFKEGAIELAWELVTKPRADGGWGLEESRLYPTVYGDDEALDAVEEGHRLPDERIVRLGQEGELLVDGRARPRWAVLGDPLRPRPEPRSGLHARRARAGHAGQARGPLPRDLEPGLHAGRAVSAVRSKEDFDIVGSLPKQNIDTGMGLERVAFLLQGVDNMYEIDVMFPVIEQAQELTGRATARRPAGPRGRRPVPGGGRPRPQLDDADRRRRHPRQRGPRLRPAPADAARDPLDAAAGLRGPGAARAAAGQPGQDGRDLRRAAPRLGADLDGGVRRGGRVPADAAGRHRDLRHRRPPR